jgi:hypothetical protein
MSKRRKGKGDGGGPTRAWRNLLERTPLGRALLVGDACCLGLALPLGLHELHLIRVHPPQLPHVALVPLAQPLQPRPRLPEFRRGLPAAQVAAGLRELVRLRPRQGLLGGVEAAEEGAQEAVRPGGGERHGCGELEDRSAVAEAAGMEQPNRREPS